MAVAKNMVAGFGPATKPKPAAAPPQQTQGERPTAAPEIPLPATPTPGPPPAAPTMSAEADPTLLALQDKYSKYIGDIEAGTGRAVDVTQSRIRDAAEAEKTAARERASERGVGGQGGDAATAEEQAIEDRTQRRAAGAGADIALGREGMMLNALGGASGNAQATAAGQRAENAQGLDAYGQYQNAMNSYNQASMSNVNTVFNQLLALLGARRGSPLSQPYY